MPEDQLGVPGYAINLPSMQNPGLVDWRLSPGSFAAVPQMLVGPDGTETFTPANFATTTFHLRQVARLGGEPKVATYSQAAVNEYVVSVIPIGHSLGQVIYSLPLAPGESVRIAVVDWRRADSGAKTDTTTTSEKLVHDQTRDRTVTEVVDAALKEWQRGGSVMGGLAAGAGATGSYGPFSAAAGGMSSIGGAYTTSSGNRDLRANTTQRVNDSVHQASALFRDQTTTVVVQTEASEREVIETRAFANHNRGHTLNIMYYEVLRHFRIVTEPSRTYRAALVKRPTWDLRNDDMLLAHRFVLQPALLDTSFAPAFDALQRIDTLRKDLARKDPIPPPPPGDGELEFTRLKVRFKIGGEESTNAVRLEIQAGGATQAMRTGGTENLNKDEQFDNEDTEFWLSSDPLTPRVKWKDLQQFTIAKTSGTTKLRIVEIDIFGEFSGGSRHLHRHVMGMTYAFDNNEVFPLMAEVPPPAPVAAPAPKVDQLTTAEDHAAVLRLKEHLKQRSAYYARVLDLTRHSDDYARELDAVAWNGTSTALDHLSPMPLEVLGDYLAFERVDWDEGDEEEEEEEPDVMAEQLMSLPTRGVFAEAKLGHANVAEEIDETRLWRWDEHPLPFVASDIAAAQPVTPTPGDLPLQATPLPAQGVTIQAPAALPEPQGLAAALKVLSTPDIFRDMSAADEVQELLGDLIEGAVDMAGAANRAKEIQQKIDTQKQSAARAVDAVKSVAEVEQARQETAANQVTPAQAREAIQTAANAERKGDAPAGTTKKVASNQLGNMKGSKGTRPIPTVSRVFFVELIGYGNARLSGQFKWSLFQPERVRHITSQDVPVGGYVIGNSLMERMEDGKFVIKFVDDVGDPRFHIDVVGEILSGHGVNAMIKGQIGFTVPDELWKSNRVVTITALATIDTMQVEASSTDEVLTTMRDRLSMGAEVAVPVVKITGEAGTEWGKDHKVTGGQKVTVAVAYYKGGFGVPKIS